MRGGGGEFGQSGVEQADAVNSPALSLKQQQSCTPPKQLRSQFFRSVFASSSSSSSSLTLFFFKKATFSTKHNQRIGVTARQRRDSARLKTETGNFLINE